MSRSLRDQLQSKFYVHRPTNTVIRIGGTAPTFEATNTKERKLANEYRNFLSSHGLNADGVVRKREDGVS